MGSSFRDNDWFSKLPYLGMQLAAWPLAKIPEVAHILSFPQGLKIELILTLETGYSEILAKFQTVIFQHEFQKWHIYCLSNPGGRNWAHFCSMGSCFRDTGHFSNLPYLGIKLGKWPKFQKLHIYPLSTPQGRNWAYYGQQFPTYRPIFKIVIVGHETWPKVARI